MARIINLAQPDDEGTLYASMEEAENALEAMIEGLRAQNYHIEEEEFPGEDYPRYTVNDENDQWIGTFTIDS